MSFVSLLNALAQVDATLSACVATLFVVFTQASRPKRTGSSTRRIMEALLSAILLWVLAVRFGVTALAVALAPEAVLGPGVPEGGVWALAALCAVLCLVGIWSHRGAVAARISGAVTLFLAALAETWLSFALLDVSALARADTVLSCFVGAAALVLAAFHWTHRTSTPNPLGGHTRPLDY